MLEAVQEVEMVLEQDEFIVSYDAAEATEDQIVAAASQAGFATRVVAEAAPLRTDTPTAPDGELPPFFVEAQEQARRENKLLVIDFSASWCFPCQRMIRETFPDPRVARLLEQCVFLTVDTDEYVDLTKQRFGVDVIPDIRVLSPAGEEIGHLTDYHPPEEFAAFLSDLLQP